MYYLIQRKVKVKSLSRVWLFAAPWTVAYQAPASMGFSRQEYWSGLPFPSPDLPYPGIEPRSPALEADALTSEPPGNLPPRQKCLNCLLRKVIKDHSQDKQGEKSNLADIIHLSEVFPNKFSSLPILLKNKMYYKSKLSWSILLEGW